MTRRWEHHRWSPVRWRDDRRLRRASWLGRDLRTRRQLLRRSRWRDLAALLAAFAASGALIAVGVRRWPFAVGLVVGAYVRAVSVLLLVVLAIGDGSLLPRLGRAVEADVGNDVRQAPGVYAVVSGISFAHRDVDHVVLAAGGCFAVEVKATFGRRGSLRAVSDLPGKLAQTRAGARQIQLLLASRGVPLPVTPLLVLAGPGAPDLTAPERHEDVLVATAANSETWQLQLTSLGATLDEATARAAVAELLAYRSQRTEHTLARSR